MQEAEDLAPGAQEANAGKLRSLGEEREPGGQGQEELQTEKWRVGTRRQWGWPHVDSQLKSDL